MHLINLRHREDTVNFSQAVLRGLGRDHGLYFPEKLAPFADVEQLMAGNFHERCTRVLTHLIGDEFDAALIARWVENAFSFTPELHSIGLHSLAPQTKVLELFHGPTLAFKDFGARFLAQVLQHLIADGQHSGPLTILSATSGDTGAAVAHAFHGIANVQVVILYPYQRISALQEKMFCTLGGNIHTLAVRGDFDQCQQLVKAAFSEREFVQRFGLNSANSINIARLLAQVCYYVEACALWPQAKQLQISVPSGNFGNITAGMIAKAIGAPIAGFIAATNSNDTVPRYLSSGIWDVHPTIATLSNAMDVSAPNNWPRSQALMAQAQLTAAVISEAETIAAMRELHALGYIADPHTAVAYAGLQQQRQAEADGIFLSTAHPAKFRETIAEHLGVTIALPPELAACVDKSLLSRQIDANLGAVKAEVVNAWQ